MSPRAQEIRLKLSHEGIPGVEWRTSGLEPITQAMLDHFGTRLEAPSELDAFLRTAADVGLTPEVPEEVQVWRDRTSRREIQLRARTSLDLADLPVESRRMLATLTPADRDLALDLGLREFVVLVGEISPDLARLALGGAEVLARPHHAELVVVVSAGRGDVWQQLRPHLPPATRQLMQVVEISQLHRLKKDVPARVLVTDITTSLLSGTRLHEQLATLATTGLILVTDVDPVVRPLLSWEVIHVVARHLSGVRRSWWIERYSDPSHRTELAGRLDGYVVRRPGPAVTRMLTLPMESNQQADYNKVASALLPLVEKQGLNAAEGDRVAVLAREISALATGTGLTGEGPVHSGKLDGVVAELKSAAVSLGRRVVVFCQHEDLNKELLKHLEDAGVPATRFYRRLAARKREEMIPRFNAETTGMVLVCPDMDLSDQLAADLVVHLDIPWNSEVLFQRMAKVLPGAQVLLCPAEGTLEVGLARLEISPNAAPLTLTDAGLIRLRSLMVGSTDQNLPGEEAFPDLQLPPRAVAPAPELPKKKAVVPRAKTTVEKVATPEKVTTPEKVAAPEKVVRRPRVEGPQEETPAKVAPSTPAAARPTTSRGNPVEVVPARVNPPVPTRPPTKTPAVVPPARTPAKSPVVEPEELETDDLPPDVFTSPSPRGHERRDTPPPPRDDRNPRDLPPRRDEGAGRPGDRADHRPGRPLYDEVEGESQLMFIKPGGGGREPEPNRGRSWPRTSAEDNYPSRWSGYYDERGERNFKGPGGRDDGPPRPTGDGWNDPSGRSSFVTDPTRRGPGRKDEPRRDDRRPNRPQEPLLEGRPDRRPERGNIPGGTAPEVKISVESPVKAAEGTPVVDIPVKAAEITPVVESPVKAAEITPVVESPVKAVETIPVVESPVKAVEPIPVVDIPVKAVEPSPVVESPVKAAELTHLVESPVKAAELTPVVESPVKAAELTPVVESPVKAAEPSPVVEATPTPAPKTPPVMEKVPPSDTPDYGPTRDSWAHPRGAEMPPPPPAEEQSRAAQILDGVEIPLKAMNRLLAGVPVLGRPLSEAARLLWEQLNVTVGRK